MSKYFGDAGISDRQFGRIINMYFIRGMTVSEIKDVLNDEQLKLFNEFLETDNGKYLSKLTSEEIMAIVMYTRTGDRAINKSLRTGNYTGTFSYTDEYTGKTKTITIEKFISDLNSALEKFGGIKEDTVIYRAVKLTTFTRYNSIFTRLFESIKNVDDCVEIYSVMRNLVGERFSDLGFMSASPAYNTSYAMYDGFPVVLEILTPKGTPGAYINQISKDYNRENEFLYMNDTSLTILDVQLLHNYGDVNGVDKVVVRCIVDNNIDIDEEYDDAVMSSGEEDLDDGYELEAGESLSDRIGIQYFASNSNNSYSNLFSESIKTKFNKIVDSLFTYLLNKGYMINIESLRIIKNSPKMILGSIKNAKSDSDISDVLHCSNLSILSKKELNQLVQILLQKKYDSYWISDIIKSNFNYVMWKIETNSYSKFAIDRLNLDNFTDFLSISKISKSVAFSYIAGCISCCCP